MSSVTFRLRGPKKHRDAMVETIRSRWDGTMNGRVNEHPPYTEVMLIRQHDFDYVATIQHVTDGMFRVNPNSRDGKATWVGEGRRKVGLELMEISWSSGGATVWDSDDTPEMVQARSQMIAAWQSAPETTRTIPCISQDLDARFADGIQQALDDIVLNGTYREVSVASILRSLGLGSSLSQANDAEHRATELLREMLSPDEQQQLKDNQYLEVPSTVRQGRTYRIPNLSGYVAVYEDGNHTENLCVQPTETIPDADWILLQKLMIQGNEQEWLKIANHLPVARNRWHVADEQAVRVTPFYTLRVTDECAEDALQGWHVRLRDLMAERNVLQRVRASIFTESAYQTNKAVSWRRDPETVAGDALIEESPQYMRVVIRRLEDGEVPGSDTELECVPA